MAKIWQMDDAEARFGEIIDAALLEGPQILTDKGVDKVVLVPIQLWRDLKSDTKSSLKELLLATEPRTDALIAQRLPQNHRPSPEF